MDKNSKIYVAGHKGLVGSAIVKNLRSKGYENIITRTHGELDLMDQKAVYEFFEKEKQMKSFVSSLLEKEDFTEEDIEAWNEEHEDDDSYINVHEFKYVA